MSCCEKVIRIPVKKWYILDAILAGYPHSGKHNFVALSSYVNILQFLCGWIQESFLEASVLDSNHSLKLCIGFLHEYKT